MSETTSTINEMIAEMTKECTTKVTRQHALGFEVSEYKGYAERQINGKNVSVSLIENYRNSKANDKPRMMWKIEGKRIKAIELVQTLGE